MIEEKEFAMLKKAIESMTPEQLVKIREAVDTMLVKLYDAGQIVISNTDSASLIEAATDFQKNVDEMYDQMKRVTDSMDNEFIAKVTTDKIRPLEKWDNG